MGKRKKRQSRPPPPRQPEPTQPEQNGPPSSGAEAPLPPLGVVEWPGGEEEQKQLLAVVQYQVLGPFLFGQHTLSSEAQKCAIEADLLPKTEGVWPMFFEQTQWRTAILVVQVVLTAKKLCETNQSFREFLLTGHSAVLKETLIADILKMHSKPLVDYKTPEIQIVYRLLRLHVSTLGDQASEIAIFIQSLSEKEQLVLPVKERGNGNFKSGRYRAAIGDYTRATSIYPYSSVLYCNRALCYLRNTNTWNACVDSYRALVLRQDWEKPYHRCSEAWLRLGCLHMARVVNGWGNENCREKAELVKQMKEISIAMETRENDSKPSPEMLQANGDGGGGGEKKHTKGKSSKTRKKTKRNKELQKSDGDEKGGVAKGGGASSTAENDSNSKERDISNDCEREKEEDEQVRRQRDLEQRKVLDMDRWKEMEEMERLRLEAERYDIEKWELEALEAEMRLRRRKERERREKRREDGGGVREREREMGREEVVAQKVYLNTKHGKLPPGLGQDYAEVRRKLLGHSLDGEGELEVGGVEGKGKEAGVRAGEGGEEKKKGTGKERVVNGSSSSGQNGVEGKEEARMREEEELYKEVKQERERLKSERSSWRAAEDRKRSHSLPQSNPYQAFETLRLPSLGGEVPTNKLFNYLQKGSFSQLVPEQYTLHSEAWRGLEPLPPLQPLIRPSPPDSQTNCNAAIDELWCPLLGDLSEAAGLVPARIKYVGKTASKYMPNYPSYYRRYDL